MAKIMMPDKAQESSMGRRLFAMAAPAVGMALGGPAGAAAGSFLGGKVSGKSTQDSLLGAAQEGMGGGSNPLERRLSAKSQDPQAGISAGLDALSSLDKPLRDKYTGVLVQAQMLGNPKYGGGR